MAIALAGCQADMDTPELKDPVSTLTPNTTILELKDQFNGQTALIGEKTPANGDTPAEHYIISGRVISSDASGNIYKSLVIQDGTAALAFSLNQTSMYVDYPLGQEVIVDMTGLHIGYYSGLMQIGAPDEPYNGEPQLGFMPYFYFQEHAQKNGMPNPDCEYIPFAENVEGDNIHGFIFDTFEGFSGIPANELQSQLVELRNVHFEGAGELRYANYQETANRNLLDSDGGDALTVRNSGYANFYNNVLPKGNGKVRGILSYYGSKYQLVLRDINDVMISEKGSEMADALTITEADTEFYTGVSKWVKGYIVGSVKAGVDHVTSADDIIFGADADLDNNLVISTAPDDNSLENLMIVELPQNSVFRYYGNLADNPGNYKKAISVYGTISPYLGFTGLINNPGDRDSFKIEGVEPGTSTGDVPQPSGSGTEADPYNMGYVATSTGDINNVWVIGYVTGYVKADPWNEENFVLGGSPDLSSSYYLNSNNVILSEKPIPNASMTNSVPATLRGAVKPTLGIKDNPQIIGKRVKVRGNITEIYQTRGVKNVSEVIVLE